MKYNFKLKEHGFWRRFFRRDVSYNTRWHRLAKTLFIGFLVIIPLYSALDELELSTTNSYWHWVEIVDTVESRVGDDVVRIGSLLKSDEHLYTGMSENKIGDMGTQEICPDFSLGCNAREKDLERMYCSKKWDVRKLNDLAEKTHLKYQRPWDGKFMSMDALLDDVSIMQCIDVDTYKETNYLTVSYYSLDELYFAKVTAKANLWQFGEWFLFYLFDLAIALVFGFVFIVIYYRIVVWIICGSYKENNKK